MQTILDIFQDFKKSHLIEGHRKIVIEASEFFDFAVYLILIYTLLEDVLKKVIHDDTTLS